MDNKSESKFGSTIAPLPSSLEAIWKDTVESGFTMPSDHQTGALLRTLAASRPSARILELGTGTGLSTAWILDGLNSESTLDSIDTDTAVSAIAQRHLGDGDRLKLHVADGADFLAAADKNYYELIFADAWPGKFTHLDLAINALMVGGLYVIDDLLPQPNWPEGHYDKVNELRSVLKARDDLHLVELAWSTGLILASKTY